MFIDEGDQEVFESVTGEESLTMFTLPLSMNIRFDQGCNPAGVLTRDQSAGDCDGGSERHR